MTKKAKKIKQHVKERYAKVATGKTCCDGSSCSSSNSQALLAKAIGYSSQELENMPTSVTNAVAGCGNPTALAELKEGETVLDLGSGGGIDAFLAAEKVGSKGKVVGVDMTEEMVQLAKENAAKMGAKNVEFRLGEIEKLPVQDGTVDVIISNCVINLSPEKERVFKEAFRVLKNGGRILISDLVTQGQLPKEIREDPEMWSACIAGALDENDYLKKIRDAGFEKVEVVGKTPFMEKVSSIKVRAYKPTD
jgi:arsenite methyltransferase